MNYDEVRDNRADRCSGCEHYGKDEKGYCLIYKYPECHGWHIPDDCCPLKNKDMKRGFARLEQEVERLNFIDKLIDDGSDELEDAYEKISKLEAENAELKSIARKFYSLVDYADDEFDEKYERFLIITGESE